MYTVTVTRDLIAQHWLTVPDPGPEGEKHSHQFSLEARLTGPELNEYGYLVDIDRVNGALDAIESRYRDATLNELPEFEGQNPSVERFARLVCDRLIEDLQTTRLTELRVRIWEDASAAASYTASL